MWEISKEHYQWHDRLRVKVSQVETFTFLQANPESHRQTLHVNKNETVQREDHTLSNRNSGFTKSSRYIVSGARSQSATDLLVEGIAEHTARKDARHKFQTFLLAPSPTLLSLHTTLALQCVCISYYVTNSMRAAVFSVVLFWWQESTDIHTHPNSRWIKTCLPIFGTAYIHFF